MPRTSGSSSINSWMSSAALTRCAVLVVGVRFFVVRVLLVVRVLIFVVRVLLVVGVLIFVVRVVGVLVVRVGAGGDAGRRLGVGQREAGLKQRLLGRGHRGAPGPGSGRPDSGRPGSGPPGSGRPGSPRSGPAVCLLRPFGLLVRGLLVRGLHGFGPLLRQRLVLRLDGRGALLAGRRCPSPGRWRGLALRCALALSFAFCWSVRVLVLVVRVLTFGRLRVCPELVASRLQRLRGGERRSVGILGVLRRQLRAVTQHRAPVDIQLSALGHVELLPVHRHDVGSLRCGAGGGELHAGEPGRDQDASYDHGADRLPPSALNASVRARSHHHSSS